MSALETRSQGSASSSECKFEKALRLAEERLAKEARHPALKMEVQMRLQELKAKHDAKEAARKDWHDNFTAQRSVEIQDKMHAVRGRREQAQQFIRVQAQDLLAVGDAKARAAEAKKDAIARQRAEEEALNREIASHRDSHIADTISKASAVQNERTSARRLSQEMTAQRRSLVEVEIARERAASAERRRARSEYVDSRLRAHSQHLEGRRQEKEAKFAQKREQAEAEHRRRDAIMEHIRKLHVQRHHKASQLKELAWQAAVTNREDTLRQELEALVPRLASAPTTPRSPGNFNTPSNHGVSPQSHQTPRASAGSPRRVNADRFIPATFYPTTPRQPTPTVTGKPNLWSPVAGLEPPLMSPTSVASLTSSRSSFSGGAALSPRRQKLFGRFGPISSAQSLGSTRASLQASSPELVA